MSVHGDGDRSANVEKLILAGIDSVESMLLSIERRFALNYAWDCVLLWPGDDLSLLRLKTMIGRIPDVQSRDTMQ
jgi:hypothetical protein